MTRLSLSAKDKNGILGVGDFNGSRKIWKWVGKLLKKWRCSIM